MAYAPGRGRARAPERIRRVARVALLYLAIVGSVAARLAAHDDLSGQIAALSLSIAAEPARADLYLRRGDLRRAAGDLTHARDDIDRAAALDPRLAPVHLARARLLVAEGRLRDAETEATRFLEAEPRHVEALLLRARARAEHGSRAGAVGDFDRVLAGRPVPDIYLERARLLASAPAQLDEALRGLDEGIARLGPLVTLDLEAMQLEVRLRRYDAALDRIDAQLTRALRREQWLARRGDVLAQAGRSAEAAQAYRAALAAASALPPRVRATPATLALVEESNAKLQQLADIAPPSSAAGSITP